MTIKAISTRLRNFLSMRLLIALSGIISESKKPTEKGYLEMISLLYQSIGWAGYFVSAN